MKPIQFVAAILLAVACFNLPAQIKRTSIPIGDAVSKALAKGSITGEGARSFHIRVEVSEPENPQSPYRGSFEEWWVSPDQWRREVRDIEGLHQTIVTSGAKKTEKDEGDYFPVWLRNFVTAVFDPIPAASQWAGSDLMIEQTFLPNGAKSDACARKVGKLGSEGRDSKVYFNVCFDEEGRLKFIGSPSYSMEFHDYRGFGKKQIARELTDDPESGTKLVGKLTVLEEMAKVKDQADLFAVLPSDEDRFKEVQVNAETLERLTAGSPAIVWPTVHSGNTRGREAIYISVDTTGRVREAWPLNSDNGGVDDSVRDQVRKWTVKPAIDQSGKRVQVDGGLSFSFETRIADPLPELSDAEIRQLATKIVEPVFPPGSVKSGQVLEVDVSVDEHGQLAGANFHGLEAGAVFALDDAIKKWTFLPLMRNGKAQYFHGTVKFVAP
jgi:hypothetical protein